MQLEKNWLITASSPEYWGSRDTILHLPSDRSTEAVHYNVFNKTICVCYINSSSGHLFIMCDHCCYSCVHS